MTDGSLAALLAAGDLDEVEALREHLDEPLSDGSSETIRRTLADWSDRQGVGNLLLCADLVVPTELAVPAIERAVDGEQGDARLAACAAVGAQRLADADLLEEPLRARLIDALVTAAGTRRDAAAARAGYALVALAEPADAPALLALADVDDPLGRHNALALLLNLVGVSGVAGLVQQVESAGIADRRLGGALQARVALDEAGVELTAPDDAAVPPGHPLRAYRVPAIPDIPLR
ncbi:MAG: hypothetical protein ACTHOD_13295 [Motilibacteraceae bacterium]